MHLIPLKGLDYLGDQDAIEIMCQDAPRAVIELEHMGMPFSRTPEGKIAQRKFGGHTKPEDPNDPNSKRISVKRACYSADRTGHVMLIDQSHRPPSDSATRDRYASDRP